MLKKSGKILAVAALALCASGGAAFADNCHSDHATGTLLGAIVGGVIGNQFGHGGGKVAATAGGVLFGGMAGNAISRDMDCNDRPYAERSYHDSFYGPVGHRYDWEHDRDRGYITTTREYWRHGRLCRDFTEVHYYRGREYDHDGTACRHRDGEWEMI
jgi:surface antigen